jgi:hypothetical protein
MWTGRRWSTQVSCRRISSRICDPYRHEKRSDRQRQEHRHDITATIPAARRFAANAFNGDAALYRTAFRKPIAVHGRTPGIIDKAGMTHMVEGLQIMEPRKNPVDWDTITDARLRAAKIN